MGTVLNFPRVTKTQSSHNITLESKYGIPEEISAMSKILDLLPDFIRDSIAIVYCDSKACLTYTVGFKACRFRRRIPEIFVRATVTAQGGYNYINFVEIGPSGDLWGDDCGDLLQEFDPSWNGDSLYGRGADPNRPIDGAVVDLVEPFVVPLDDREPKRRRCPSCGHNEGLLSKPRLKPDGNVLHAGGLRCLGCGRHICWLRADEVMTAARLGRAWRGI